MTLSDYYNLRKNDKVKDYNGRIWTVWEAGMNNALGGYIVVLNDKKRDKYRLYAMIMRSDAIDKFEVVEDE